MPVNTELQLKRYSKRVIAYLLFALLALTCPALLADDSQQVTREYPVPEHGMLQLTMPEAWNVTYYKPAEFNSPVIICYPQQQPYPFQLTLSPLWDSGYFRDITAPDFIEQYVRAVGNDVLQYSDQSQLELQPLTGTAGQGYYFQVSDQAAPEHEFKYLMEGAIAVNEVLLVFSYFSNRAQDENIETVLRMMQSAAQNLQRDVNLTHLLK